MNYKHGFLGFEWVEVGTGVRQKILQFETTQLRLVEFSESFVEKDWCTKGHVGVVISGSMKVDFNGVIQKFEKGDALNIPSGKDHRHKVLMGAGDRVELMLFEEL